MTKVLDDNLMVLVKEFVVEVILLKLTNANTNVSMKIRG